MAGNVLHRWRVAGSMEHASYYRLQAARAKKLAARLRHRDAAELLRRVAGEYDEIAEDLENGAVVIRHQERMPQYRRLGGRRSAN
jgi:hypothetical protein